MVFTSQCDRAIEQMKKYKVYGIGAALVDTEVKVDDADLAAMNVEKGLMTLVDEARLHELLGHLDGHLVKATHASGGSGGNYHHRHSLVWRTDLHVLQGGQRCRR